MTDHNTTITASAITGAEHSSGLSVYKSGQGYYTRMGTVIGVLLVTLLGIQWLWQYLLLVRIGTIPTIYIATAGAVLAGGAAVFVMYYLVFVKPRTVDFLVATEGEMKKVNWSTRREIVGSTVAVITSAFILTVFCWFVDLGFSEFFKLINVLRSN